MQTPLWLSRSRDLIGEEELRFLSDARVALLGLGGVGGSCAEALCRTGIGHLLLCDSDTVEETNLNRQTVAAHSTLGQKKTAVMARRLRDINPDIDLCLEERFYLPEESGFLYDFQPDLVLDAVDTVTAKIHLAAECTKRGIPLVSCLGTGNRLHPELLTAGDLSETSGCPLARVMRRELRKKGVSHLRVVYSTEAPVPGKTSVPDASSGTGAKGRHPPCSSAFVPPAAGCLLAAEGVRLLLAART